MNKREAKVLRLWQKGERDLSRIAHRLGFTGNATTAGIEKVRKILIDNGITL